MASQIFTLSFTAIKGTQEIRAKEEITAEYLSLEGMDYLGDQMAKRHNADKVEVESVEQDFYGKSIKIWSKSGGKVPEIQIANEFIDGCETYIEQFRRDETLKKIWEDRLRQFGDSMKADSPGIFELIKNRVPQA